MDIDIGDSIGDKCTPMQIKIFTMYVGQFITFSVFDLVARAILLIFGLYLENFKSFIYFFYLFIVYLYIYSQLFIASLSEKKRLGQYFP